MHRFVRPVALAGALVFSLMSTGIVASAHAAPADHVAGYVYVNNNTAGQNTISGFARHIDGTLTPLAGLPFAIGGAGIGSATGSQGALQMSHDGKYLLAVDAGSNQISVIPVNHDGSLGAASPVPSGGTTPVSIAVHDHLVYVANAGVGGSNYTGFTFEHGQLAPIPGSSFALPDNANPGDVLFNHNGKTLVGVRVGPDAGPSYIDSFSVSHDGLLTPAEGSPMPSQVTGPFGSVFSPKHHRQLFVTNAHGGAGAGSVSVYDVKKSALTPLSNSPFANGQSGTCWAEISRDGRYLFAVNTGSNTISRYAVGNDGTLTLLGNTPMTNPGPGGLRAFDARLAPHGDYLYVVDATGRVSAFAVHSGNLTELTSSPFPTTRGSTPFGIVVT